ncbi:MAG: hypothetical protein KIT11_05775 [Fimbriimonadaceae bacterium]|nr:hypothetical protein [Fimbriimonadaceae bacterium]QYK56598.1 MAG: hypothetical protein KF733_03740 [Fimbriimonadaceae bacterium]
MSILLAAAAGSLAQGTFTIRRPLENSTVREVIKIRVPKTGIPEGGYIGVYVDDLSDGKRESKFLEAAMPALDGGDYVYDLDSQARGLTDGPWRIELVLFRDANGKPQVIDRSSVDVVVDNHKSIKVPAQGLTLRYKFAPGTNRTYKFTVTQSTAMVSQAQARLGSRAAGTIEQQQEFRINYGIDQSYLSGTEGLVRIQGLADKGKDYATVILPGQQSATKLPDYRLTPVYMRITNTGREVFSSIPAYFGIEGQSASVGGMEYTMIAPLPVLPSKPVKPGDVWQGTYLFTAEDLRSQDIHMKEKITRNVPARGTFQEVVWYQGLPCAKLVTTVALGESDLVNVQNLRQVEGKATKIELTETTYFALDRGAVVRIESKLVQEALVETAAPLAQSSTSGVGGGGGGGLGNPAGGGEATFRRKQGGAAGTSASANWASPFGAPGIRGGSFAPGDEETLNQQRRRGGAAGFQDPDSDDQGDNPGPRGQFGQNPGFGGGGGGQKMILRITAQWVAELER